LIILLLFIWLILGLVRVFPTEHTSCMYDCKNIFTKDYQYETQCYSSNITSFIQVFGTAEIKEVTYACNKTIKQN